MITINVKKILDKPAFRPVTPGIGTAYSASSAAQLSGAAHFASDMRSRNYAHPELFLFSASSNLFTVYNPVTDGWKVRAFSNAFGGTVNAGGMGWAFAPSRGPSGTLSSGNTTTKVVLSTALPAAVLENGMANRGDGVGYIIRIIGSSSGGSGKIEERRIVANTSGTTPTITLDAALTFTPASGDSYEILSGRLYMLSTGSSKEWRYHDILTESTSSALSTTNLPGTVSASYNDLVVLDEALVPYNRYPGEGFVVDGTAVYDNTSGWVKKCLTATATASGTLTGQASSGDSAVTANQYRNFQIRIVEDTGTPTAVGQRRRITSHTAGASPVYTLASNWTVTPSSTAKYVIEYDNDKIILLTAATTTVYNYNVGSNTWDTSTWATRPVAATQAGGSFMAFGIVPDSQGISKNSQLFSFRGGSSNNNPMDILDIAGASTGSWSTIALTPNTITTSIIPTSGNWGACYDPISLEGRYIYFLLPVATNSGPVNLARFDMITKTWMPYASVATTVSTTGTGSLANRMAYFPLIDGTSSLGFIYLLRPGAPWGELFEAALII